MRETIKIGKMTWVVAEPDTAIIPENRKSEVKNGWLDRTMLAAAVTFLNWLGTVKIPWPENFSKKRHQPESRAKPRIEFGDGWGIALHVIGGVLQAVLIVLGSVARVIGASMASSICW